ncbi:prepilin peptidase [Belnapia sp. T6]|uniref:Prepilin peptidase n=1 Tax=Belnapia mucosa TaxID=2804532 RepID=A0ABS1V650_9PROT|nr:A24 family peptidase [Belnapia mucosa]MBL6457168.1 prepilin peptidase [Belnapia mucosa]
MMATKLAIGLLLILAAGRDVATRTIPDGIVLLIALLGLVGRLAIGPAAMFQALPAALLLFLVLLGLAMRGWLGGGDAKLAGALALGLPPATTWNFVLFTSLAGGVLGLGYIAGRVLLAGRAPRQPLAAPLASPAAPLARVLAVEAWRLRRGGPLPYGVAIAAGGLLALLEG